MNLIYKITDLTNSKIYVGKTKNLKRRIREYSNTKVSKKRKYRIMNIIREKGISNFEFSIIEENIPDEKIDEREMYWIKTLQSRDIEIGYNSKAGGIGGKMIDYSLEQMSINSRKFRHTEEEKKRRSKPIIVFNNCEYKIYNSAKIYSDILNTSRSVVTSSIRNGKRLHGRYIYYYDDIKRNKFLLKNSHKQKYFEIGNVINEVGVETIESIIYII